MHTVGVDVHQGSSVLLVLDRHGKQVASRRVRSGWDTLYQDFEQLRGPFQIC